MPGAVIGVLVIGVAAWGGIVPFVGPTFDFDMGGTTRAWVWTQSHWTLHLTPAVVGIVGGLLIMFTHGRAGRVAGALLTILAGVWFVIGPTLAPLWQHSGITTGGSVGPTGTRTVRVLEGIGYHYGTGVVLMLLGTMALAFLPSRTAVEPAPLPAVEDQPQETEAETEVREGQPSPA
jgi:hypothetical protein